MESSKDLGKLRKRLWIRTG